jgi:hypothetical protein
MALGDNLWKASGAVTTEPERTQRLISEFYDRENTTLDLTPRFVDDLGNPTPFAETSANVFGAYGSRLNRGSGSVGDAWYLKSLGQVARDVFDSDYTPLGSVSNGMFLQEGQTIPLEETTAEAVLDSASESQIAFYEASGLTKSDILKRVDNDPVKLQKFHREFTEFHRHNMLLEGYHRDHGLAYWVAGAGAFATDVVTDPITILTFGAGGIAKGAGTATARFAATKSGQTIAKVAGKNTAVSAISKDIATRFQRFARVAAQGDPSLAIAEAIAPMQRTWASRVLKAGVTTEVVSTDFLSQYAEHETSVLFGLQADEAEFEWNPVRTFGAGLVGFALSSIAARNMNLRTFSPTAREFIAHNRVHPVSDHLSALIEARRIDADAPLDTDLVADLEGMYDYAHASFGADANRITSLFENHPIVDTPGGLRLIARYISQKPTEAELSKFLDDIVANTDLDGFYRMLDDIDMDEVQVPRTAWLEAKTRLMAAADARRIAAERNDLEGVAKANKELRKAQSQLDAVRAQFPKRGSQPNRIQDTQVREWIADDRAAPLISVDQEATQAQARADHVVGKVLASDNITTVPTRAIQRLLRRITLQDPNRLARTTERDLANVPTSFQKLYVMLRGIVDDGGLDSYVRDAEGRQYTAAYRRMGEIRGLRNNMLESIQRHIGSDNDFNDALADEIGGEVLLALASKRTLANPKLQLIADEVRKYMDTMAIRGNNSGFLSNILQDYLPVKVYSDRLVQKFDEVADLLTNYWMRRYDPRIAGENVPVNRKLINSDTLNVTEEIDGKRVFKETGQPVPARVNQLPEEIYERYLEELPGFLRAEAKRALDRKLGRPVDDPFEARVGARWESNRQARVIDQEFWYSEDVMRLGVLDTNLNRITADYERGVGWDIALQETMTEVFGEAVTFRQALETLKKLVRKSGNPNNIEKELIGSLETVEGFASQRTKSFGNNPFTQFANSFARAVTFGSVPMVILGTEGSVAMARILGKGNIRRAAKAIHSVMTQMSNAEMRRAGWALDLEYDASRYFFSAEEMHAANSSGKILGAMHATENFIRKFGGEQFITRRLKMLHYYYSSSVMHEYRNKLGKMENLVNGKWDRSTPEGDKAFKAAAREAGFGSRYDIADALLRTGTVSRETLPVIRAYKEMGGETLGNIIEMRRRVDDLPEELQTPARKFLRGLSTYAQEDAEAFVTSASPNSVFRTNNSFANLFFMYTTFPMAFVQKSMTRAFRAPALQTVGYLGVYMMGEMLSNNLRRAVYYGESPDDIYEEWKENPLQNFVGVALRAPITGPWAVAPEAFAPLVGANPPGFASGGSPGLGRILGAAKSMGSTVYKAATGGDVRSEDLRRISNGLPGFNSALLRVPLAAGNMDSASDEAFFNDYFEQVLGD